MSFRWDRRFTDLDGNHTWELRYHPVGAGPANRWVVLVGWIKRFRRGGRWRFELFDGEGQSLGAKNTLPEAQQAMRMYVAARGRQAGEAATNAEA